MRQIVLATILLGLAFTARAEDYIITLPATQLDYVMTTLAEKPFKDVATVLLGIQRQINTQNATKQAPPPVPKPEEK